MFKLLMVDDEKWVREQFAHGVPWEEAGFVWMGAASGGKEALAMIERDPPHLLLTDITMPGMDGLQLASIVKERWPQVRIIILTAYSEFEYAQQAIAIGVDNYVVKVSQSGDAIVKACRKAAELIASEMNKEEQLQLQEQLNWQRHWSEKRAWLEQGIDALSEASVERGPIPASLDKLLLCSHYVVMSVGWDLYRLNAASPIAQEAAYELQQQAGMAIEERILIEFGNERAGSARDDRSADQCGPGVVVPNRDNRIVIYAGMQAGRGQEIGERKLRAFATWCREAIAQATGAECFIHISKPWRRAESDPAMIARAAKEGLEQLSSYFYDSAGMMGGETQYRYQSIDSRRIRELVKTMAAGLQAGDIEMVKEPISWLTDRQAHTHRTDPSDLIAIAQKILDPGLCDLPASIMKRCQRLSWLERWDDFLLWWNETVELLEQETNQDPNENYRREVQLMRVIIRERYAEDLQVADLAEQVNLHPSYAGMLFKNETGEHVSDYLNGIRMNKAKELLERSTMKIYEISEAVGIADYRYFCRIFKSYTGKTPTEYKKASSSASGMGMQHIGE
ncbi:response regulator [Paenibacillus sp. J5C_2022]|uniref:response regulator transcription factor n=1 Tax=Paenibacillus sp. J5C2022 TaxID=2977129 RepID=UPI0021CF8FC5|nr:response regulator [Paenibacillus sp. J5C2022]MCU6712488.1 response regulator [Paenibacillus sp. J5C2022]